MPAYFYFPYSDLQRNCNNAAHGEEMHTLWYGPKLNPPRLGTAPIDQAKLLPSNARPMSGTADGMVVHRGKSSPLVYPER